MKFAVRSRVNHLGEASWTGVADVVVMLHKCPGRSSGGLKLSDGHNPQLAEPAKLYGSHSVVLVSQAPQGNNIIVVVCRFFQTANLYTPGHST